MAMGDLFGMLKNAKEMMEKAKSVQDELAKKVVEGSAGAGMVTARVNGIGELVGLDFAPSVIDPD
ncbi:MAG: YbaB/EbfC family nucleoid-associated protein, partial [Planctomycetes bacterium]|nr:YbaB/EbfC family nucleoid-associated protein [Planctomycetota bacterium]